MCVILYFSATGNSKYVAKRIAEATDDEIVSIPDCMDGGRCDFKDEAIGIVVPTYFWSLPSIIDEFLEKASFEASYLFFVATFGTTPGATGKLANKKISDRKIDAYFAVKMVDNYTPIFDISTKDLQDKYLVDTEKLIDDIIAKVKAKEHVSHMNGSTPAFLSTLIAKPIYNARGRKTCRFRVEDTCIGCGLCEKKCPVHAIEMKGGRPIWVKDSCVMCLGCLHRCPKFSIQCGSKTKAHGQYLNPNVNV